MSNQVQPIFILPEGTQRSTGKTAQKNNIMAAKLVGETVRTTLGPKGTYDDGKTFDTSEGKEPLQFVVGEKQVIPGFDKAIEGMKVGEDKTVKIKPEEAYGARNEKLIQEVPTAGFPKDIKVEKGLALQLKDQNGRMLMALVKEIKGDKAVLDLNHPLAGKSLNFKLKLVAIE